MLRCCWEDELVPATFSNSMFGHTSLSLCHTHTDLLPPPPAQPLQELCENSVANPPPVCDRVTDTSQQGAAPVLGSIRTLSLTEHPEPCGALSAAGMVSQQAVGRAASLTP